MSRLRVHALAAVAIALGCAQRVVPSPEAGQDGGAVVDCAGAEPDRCNCGATGCEPGLCCLPDFTRSPEVWFCHAPPAEGVCIARSGVSPDQFRDCWCRGQRARRGP